MTIRLAKNQRRYVSPIRGPSDGPSFEKSNQSYCELIIISSPPSSRLLLHCETESSKTTTIAWFVLSPRHAIALSGTGPAVLPPRMRQRHQGRTEPTQKKFAEDSVTWQRASLRFPSIRNTNHPNPNPNPDNLRLNTFEVKTRSAATTSALCKSERFSFKQKTRQIRNRSNSFRPIRYVKNLFAQLLGFLQLDYKLSIDFALTISDSLLFCLVQSNRLEYHLWLANGYSCYFAIHHELKPKTRQLTT